MESRPTKFHRLKSVFAECSTGAGRTYIDVLLILLQDEVAKVIVERHTGGLRIGDELGLDLFGNIQRYGRDGIRFIL